MKTILWTSLIVNGVLLVGVGLMIPIQSHELIKASREATKWKLAAVKSYRFSAKSLDDDADISNVLAKALPNVCSALPFVNLMASQLRHNAIGYHSVAVKVTSKLDEGDLKEPLDDSIWNGK